jgi:hypothetical protein
MGGGRNPVTLSSHSNPLCVSRCNTKGPHSLDAVTFLGHSQPH